MHDRLLWLLLLAAGLGVIVWFVWFAVDPVREMNLPGTPVAEFQLVDQDGHPFTSFNLLGQPCVFAFVFTRCSLSCPQITAALKSIQNKMPGESLIVAVSVDPEHDTPEVLREYVRLHGLDAERWRLLTGPKEQLYDFLERSFGILGARPRENPNEPPGLRIAHSNRLVLVDSSGRWHESYLAVEPLEGGGFQINQPELDRLLADLRRRVGE